MPAFFDLLKRFRRDERGVFGVIFGLIAVVLVALAGCVVDFSYMQTIRSRAQTALDASALALQAKMSTLTDDQIKAQAQAIVVERLADSNVTAQVFGITKDVNAGTLNLRATIAVPTIFVQLVGVRTLNAQLQTEVTQNSSNLEVALALDLTGSMTELTSGSNPISKIQALKDATHKIIKLLVQDTQPPTAPTYTRMAMAPYSYGVNVSYATNTDGAHTYIGKVRGTPKGTTNITGAAWKTNPVVAPTISKIASKSSSSTQAVVTVNSVSSLSNGDTVYVAGLTSTSNGLSALNNTVFTIKNLSTANKTFELVGGQVTKNTSTNTAGTTTKCRVANCEVVVTSTSHGLSTGDQVYISAVTGMTQINSSAMTSPWTVGAVTASTFVLTGSTGYTYGTYSSGGTAQCLEYGCADLYIPGKSYIYVPSPNCVTERTINPYQYDDTAPGTTSTLTNPVSYMYYPSRVISGWTTRAVTDSDYCVQSPIMPLTDDKSALNDAVDNFNATGSTAGHIGLAWAWYLISPNFGYLFDNDTNNPKTTYSGAAYRTPRTIKAVILMTDGAFNTAYCSGVISSDIGCSPNNADSITQANAICAKIKASGAPDFNTQLFTVGLGIGTGVASDSAEDKTAQAFLSGCSTDPSKFYYLANSAADLDNAFTSIARSLSDLRLSK